MIVFSDVTVTYAGATRPVLHGVDVHVPEGELCLVAGGTGSGKSTLLRAVNGLVPRFTGGTLAGRVSVAGVSTRERPPRELAELVGMVGQDPLAGFTTDTVAEELAYGMEQLGVPPEVMRKRVEETLDLLGIADLRDRPLRTLSGGQQQRVAIGSVLITHPKVLVLDEPTSALDPTAAEDVLAVVTRLVHDLGVTVVMAEHRLERVVHYADRLLYLPGDGTVVSGRPSELLETAAIAPPIVELGRLAGWRPLPLSVRDARRRASTLRRRLASAPPPAPARAGGEQVVAARGVVVRYGEVYAVRGVDLELAAGEVVAVMGRNGSGKSSLLWALQERHDRVGLVPQTPGDLLFLDTVAAECALADRESGAPAGSCRALLDELVAGVPDRAHPRDLSEGQRLALVLAVQLVSAPRTVLLDEPTRGLDYPSKRHLASVVRRLADLCRAVVVASHDVEFVAQVADRVVVMAEGEVVADGPTHEVVVASPAFAPQVNKVLAPQPWLTVAQVAAALGGDRPAAADVAAAGGPTGGDHRAGALP